MLPPLRRACLDEIPSVLHPAYRARSWCALRRAAIWAGMPLGALRRAQLPLAWLCLLRLSHASRCASWCRWDLASSCFKHESCADCDCPAGSQEGCLAWCDGHCEDPKCATCRACKEHRECDPVDRRDAKIEGCASWCSTSFSSEHCGKCSCKACDFCLALYPREDEEPEIDGGDAPPSAAAPIQMTDDLRRARWERWTTAHLQECSRCCGSCAQVLRVSVFRFAGWVLQRQHRGVRCRKADRALRTVGEEREPRVLLQVAGCPML